MISMASFGKIAFKLKRIVKDKDGHCTLYQGISRLRGVNSFQDIGTK